MRRLIYILPALALVFALGCTPAEEPDNLPPPPEAPAQNERSAVGEASDIVEGYAEGLVTSVDRAKAAGTKTELSEVSTAVHAYRIENGVYPPSLDDVRNMLPGGIDLDKYAYDPKTGAVTLR